MNEEILSKFTYGMYVVSSGECGCLIDTACQITSVKDDELIISISLNKKNATTQEILKNKTVGISILANTATLDLLAKFGYKSSRDINKFDYVFHTTLRDRDKVLIDNCVAWLYGDVVNMMEFSSHVVFAISITDSYYTRPDLEPLTYNDYKAMVKSQNE